MRETNTAVNRLASRPNVSVTAKPFTGPVPMRSASDLFAFQVRLAAAEFEKNRTVLDHAFWSPDAKAYAFALNQNNQRVDELSVLTTVPMWFGLAEPNNANQTISKLAAEDHQTDWGMRIISNRSKVYDGSGYHYGAVWPLFTGWASVGEYRYHRAFPAYENLRANALQGFDGALGLPAPAGRLRRDRS